MKCHIFVCYTYQPGLHTIISGCFSSQYPKVMYWAKSVQNNMIDATIYQQVSDAWQHVNEQGSHNKNGFSYTWAFVCHLSWIPICKVNGSYSDMVTCFSTTQSHVLRSTCGAEELLKIVTWRGGKEIRSLIRWEHVLVLNDMRVLVPLTGQAVVINDDF